MLTTEIPMKLVFSVAVADSGKYILVALKFMRKKKEKLEKGKNRLCRVWGMLPQLWYPWEQHRLHCMAKKFIHSFYLNCCSTMIAIIELCFLGLS